MLKIHVSLSRFHSIHHTKFQANYSLFMPLYDYIYTTYDKTSDSLYERSLKGREEEKTDVVHLTHLTSIPSIFHLRLGFASVASRPYISGLYLWIVSPLSYLSVVLTWTFGATFTLERNKFNDRSMETWVVPRYSFQVMIKILSIPSDNTFLIAHMILSISQCPQYSCISVSFVDLI